MIAVCGAPASGKSTFADQLCKGLLAQGLRCCVVPMDGFHLDNTILKAVGTLARKGAPHTFDSAGFATLVARAASEDLVYYPIFDRSRDIAIAASGRITADIDTVIVEGNYLLMQTPEWAGLARHWDLSIYLEVPQDELRRRLIARWQDHGLTADAATKRAQENDLPNALTVLENSAAADHVFGR